MRVIVCGGRDYTDRRRIRESLDTVHAASPITLLIHGDARGADRLAGEWAKERHIAVKPVPAGWDNIDAPGAVIRLNPRTGRFYNAAAGPQRNRRMVIEGADLVVAFPGGDGTNGPGGCPAIALKAGIAVLSVEE